MDITFKGRHTSVPERFRRHAAAKLARIEKLDQKAIRVDVEVTRERNPRQSDRSERVELTIRSRGPAIRAEAAADDRYTALDLAFAKLDARLRRACDRRKVRHADLSVRSPEVLAAIAPAAAADTATAAGRAAAPAGAPAAGSPAESRDLPGPREEGAPGEEPLSDQNGHAQTSVDGLVPIQMEGDGPLIVREKVHVSHPMTIDQALLEMELVGHDFYLFHDSQCDKFSVVYRRRGYDYGVIRLIER